MQNASIHSVRKVENAKARWWNGSATHHQQNHRYTKLDVIRIYVWIKRERTDAAHRPYEKYTLKLENENEKKKKHEENRK